MGTVAITDTGIDLRPDADRTIVRFFVPGNEDVGPGDSRAGPVIERIMDLSDDEVTQAIEELAARFGHRLPRLAERFDEHAARAVYRLANSAAIGSARRRLLGAAFTHEYAIEAAALCNPSIVRHPLQPVDGGTTFVLSVRGIGEGHRSSIGFRTGSVSGAGAVTLDPPGRFPVTGTAGGGTHHRAVVHRMLAERGDDHENAAFVLDALPVQFDDAQLRDRLDALTADGAIRRHTAGTVANLERLAGCSYSVSFSASSDVSERVLWPRSPLEAHGMEDARFVEITDASAPRYCATYTAFDGAHIAQSLVTTDDFETFAVSPISGAAARGKGLALFPRRIGERYVALSRADRETNSVAYSDDLRCWDTSQTVQTPRRAWEILQLGNCGSPIETAEGWLVLTHGVGPMRTYSIGAMLLDLHEPHRVVAMLDQPLIAPRRSGGYVPNVVYTCGALAVGDLLVLPYGEGDQTISVATLSIEELVASMRITSTRAVSRAANEGYEPV
jgi:predicted GH43/DUF377 family glycosyl hydrolase